MEFLKEKAYDVFSSVLNEMYQKIKCEGIPEPKLNIRNMKTRWGTCNIKTSVITLNLQLIKTDIDCIRQVASHELVHFKVKNHGKDFYRLLEKYVPNWKELKKQWIHVIKTAFNKAKFHLKKYGVNKKTYKYDSFYSSVFFCIECKILIYCKVINLIN